MLIHHYGFHSYAIPQHTMPAADMTAARCCPAPILPSRYADAAAIEARVARASYMSPQRAARAQEDAAMPASPSSPLRTERRRHFSRRRRHRRPSPWRVTSAPITTILLLVYAARVQTVVCTGSSSRCRYTGR